MTLVALVCAMPGPAYAQGSLAMATPAASRAVEERGAAAGHSETAAERASRVQTVVDDVRARLGVTSPVRASTIAENSRIASIARDADDRNAFVLAIQQDFVDSLNDDELAAAAAHELGHVWIFTHHPFLQTEELANEIALRAVSRAALDQLYEKLWSRTGRRGELEYFPH